MGIVQSIQIQYLIRSRDARSRPHPRRPNLPSGGESLRGMVRRGAAKRCPNHLYVGVGERSVVPGQRPAGADGGGIGKLDILGKFDSVGLLFSAI